MDKGTKMSKSDGENRSRVFELFSNMNCKPTQACFSLLNTLATTCNKCIVRLQYPPSNEQAHLQYQLFAWTSSPSARSSCPLDGHIGRHPGVEAGSSNARKIEGIGTPLPHILDLCYMTFAGAIPLHFCELAVLDTDET